MLHSSYVILTFIYVQFTHNDGLYRVVFHFKGKKKLNIFFKNRSLLINATDSGNIRKKGLTNNSLVLRQNEQTSVAVYKINI